MSSAASTSMRPSRRVVATTAVRALCASRLLHCVLVLVIALLAAPASYAQVSVRDLGTVGQDANGRPELDGKPGVTPTEWYSADKPLIVANVPCPNTELTISETKTSKVEWSLSFGAEGGVEWGVVSAQLSTTFGVTVGQEHEIKIEKKVTAKPYISTEVRVFTRYQKRRYAIYINGLWEKTIDVDIPVGWYEVHKDIDPKCPCEKTSQSKTTWENYARTLTPGSALQRQVLAGVASLSEVLQLFEASQAARLYAFVTAGLQQSVAALDGAWQLGADRSITERVGFDLTRGTMDQLVSDVLDEATSNHIFDNPARVPRNPFAARAAAALRQARSQAENVNLGPGRFKAAADLYAQAFQAAQAANDFTYSSGTCAQSCHVTAASPARPGVGDTCPRGAAQVSAANYAGAALARDSVVAAFGAELATATQVVTASPLPTTLAGTQVLVKDSAGVARRAGIFLAAPNQVNYHLPVETALGPATVTITNGNGKATTGTVQIVAVAPGLFTANSSGRGLAVGNVLRVRGDGTQVYERLARFDAEQNQLVAVPLDLGPATDQVFLILYGTGLRFRSNLSSVTATIGGAEAQVFYAGAQGGFTGLDQVNLRLPRSLAGRGEVEVVLTVDGKPANVVKINIR